MHPSKALKCYGNSKKKLKMFYGFLVIVIEIRLYTQTTFSIYTCIRFNISFYIQVTKITLIFTTFGLRVFDSMDRKLVAATTTPK